MDTDELAEESVQDIYSRMSRTKKLALLMVALGPQASATLLKRFEALKAEVDELVESIN